jgi:hypothetical protein
MQVPRAPRTVIAVPIKEEAEDEIEETTVVTTKRKIRKSPSPPLVAPPLSPTYAPPGTPQVVADPTWKPMPDPRPMIPSRPASVSHDMGHGFVETITTETVRVPTPPKEKEKSSFFDKLVPKFLKPTDTGPTHTGSHIQVRVQPDQGDGTVKVDVDTSGNTAGNATTIGGDGARTAALGNIPGESTGTKAGIRPIPISKIVSRGDMGTRVVIMQSTTKLSLPPVPHVDNHLSLPSPLPPRLSQLYLPISSPTLMATYTITHVFETTLASRKRTREGRRRPKIRMPVTIMDMDMDTIRIWPIYKSAMWIYMSTKKGTLILMLKLRKWRLDDIERRGRGEKGQRGGNRSTSH